MERSVGEIARVLVGGPDVGDLVTFENEDGCEYSGRVKNTTKSGVLVLKENGDLCQVPLYQLIGYLDPQEVLYIGKGSQLGYLLGVASRGLGWR